MATTDTYGSFGEFYPFYLTEHTHPWTRVFHFFGTAGVAFLAIRSLQQGSPTPMIYAPFFAYGMAWFSHFFIEKNRPATFKYPFYSLIGDFRMFWELLTLRIPFDSRLT